MSETFDAKNGWTLESARELMVLRLIPSCANCHHVRYAVLKNTGRCVCRLNKQENEHLCEEWRLGLAPGAVSVYARLAYLQLKQKENKNDKGNSPSD